MIKFKWHNGKTGSIKDPVTIRIRNGRPYLSSVLDAEGKKIENVKAVEFEADADSAAVHAALLIHDHSEKRGLNRYIRVGVSVDSIEPDKITGRVPRTRRSVAAFAALMESRLKKNDHKGKSGWDREDCRHLLRRLKEEVQELDDQLGNCPWWKKSEKNLAATPTLLKRGKIAMEAADVANFAMMIVDRVARKSVP